MLLVGPDWDAGRSHVGKADLYLTADSGTWLAILARERNLVSALLRRQVRARGPIRLMKDFATSFPS